MRLEYYITDKEKEELKQGIKIAIPANERVLIREIVDADFAECIDLIDRNKPITLFREKVLEQMKSVPQYWKQYEYLVDNPQHRKPWEVLNEFIYVYYDDLEKKINKLWAMLTNMNQRFKYVMSGYGLNGCDVLVIDFSQIIYKTDEEIDIYIESIFVKKTELIKLLENIRKFTHDNIKEDERQGFYCLLRNLYHTNLTYTHNSIISDLKNNRKK